MGNPGVERLGAMPYGDLERGGGLGGGGREEEEEEEEEEPVF